MLYCCGRYLAPEKVIILEDDIKNGLVERKLEITHCPHCKNREKNKVVEYSFFDSDSGVRKYKRPKNRQREVVDAFIWKYETQRSLMNELRQFKQGTKSNQAFVYGLNIELKDRIKQIAVDFNGQRRLVKELLIYSS